MLVGENRGEDRTIDNSFNMLVFCNKDCSQMITVQTKTLNVHEKAEYKIKTKLTGFFSRVGPCYHESFLVKAVSIKDFYGCHSMFHVS